MKQKNTKGEVDVMIEEEVEEEKDEDEEGDDDEAGDDYDDEYDMEEEEESGGVKRDGLADMMSKILNQNIGDKVPVLAKRKTAMMKEMEGKQGDTERLKRQRIEKRAEREKQLVVPDHTSADFERQLRKLATRGVVALFNAVAKSKKEAADKEAAEKSKIKEEGKHKPYCFASNPILTEKYEADRDIEDTRDLQMIRQQSAVNVKQMTDDSFLDMLKCAPDVASSSSSGAVVTKAVAPAEKKRKDKALSAPAASSSSSTAGVTWSALQDDYGLEKGQSKGSKGGMALKNWDKDDDDSEEDEAGGDSNANAKEELEGGLRMSTGSANASKRKIVQMNTSGSNKSGGGGKKVGKGGGKTKK